MCINLHNPRYHIREIQKTPIQTAKTLKANAPETGRCV